jgi:glycosyltransferase involved in cell wall biosynthesis
MRNKVSKPRIALFAMDVIAGGNLGYGIPVLRTLFERLSEHYQIVFYSFSKINEVNIPDTLRVRHVTLRLPGRLKFLTLAVKFALDHLREPYRLIFAIAIYPTGHWAIRLGKIFNRPVLVQLIALEAVALPDIGYGNLTIPWLKSITKKVCEEADVVITVAEYQKKIALENLPSTRDIIVLPLRIDCTKFVFQKRIITSPVQFIHIAYYSPLKDQDTMFAAFGKLSESLDCHLTVIGNGFNIPKVQEMLQQLNILDKVTFKGEIDQSDIPLQFRGAHILLHTARYETGCAVIQEAMASGVAVCGTRVGILSDIGDKYAIIVPVGDVKMLAERIVELVRDPQMYDSITSAAHEWITTYDSIWSYKNYQRFIDEKLTQCKKHC